MRENEGVSETNNEPTAEQQNQFAKRDAETQIALGLFVTIIALPVIVGSLWANTGRAVVVNLVSGLVLLGIGVTMAAFGWSRRKS